MKLQQLPIMSKETYRLMTEDAFLATSLLERYLRYFPDDSWNKLLAIIALAKQATLHEYLRNEQKEV